MNDIHKKSQIGDGLDIFFNPDLECRDCLFYERDRYFWCPMHRENTDDYAYCWNGIEGVLNVASPSLLSGEMKP